MQRLLLVLSGALGGLGVLLGAFGAHGLRASLAALPDGAQRLGWWQTAAQYHLIHALAIGLAAYVADRGGSAGAGAGTVAGFCFAFGVLLFSGSLYAMTLTGARALGAVTPLGGLLFVAGWVAVAVAAWRTS